MSRTVFEVVHQDGHWQVVVDDDAVSDLQTKEVAVESARELAQDRQPSQVIIYDEDGSISEETSYPDASD